MHYVATYTFKPHLPKDQVKDLMDTFAAVGEVPGATSHHVWLDGRGGTIIGETDDATAVYRNVMAYSDWMEFEITAALPVDEVVPEVMDYLG